MSLTIMYGLKKQNKSYMEARWSIIPVFLLRTSLTPDQGSIISYNYGVSRLID